MVAVDLPLQIQFGEHAFVHDVQLGRRFHPALRRDQEVGLWVREICNVPGRPSSYRWVGSVCLLRSLHVGNDDEIVPLHPMSPHGNIPHAKKCLVYRCMQITGEEGVELLVSGAWLIRGQSIQPMVDANDDANW